MWINVENPYVPPQLEEKSIEAIIAGRKNAIIYVRFIISQIALYLIISVGLLIVHWIGWF